MFAFATVLAFAATISLSSCEEDPCKNVECGVHGTCNAGTCDCAAGYEKDTNGRCDLTWSQKFVGDYSVKDVCTDSKGKASNYAYEVGIKALTAVNTVSVSNFGGFTLTSGNLKVDASNNLVIDFTDSTGRIFKGKGTFVKATTTAGKDVINASYSITFSDKSVENCVGTYTRK